MKKLIIIKIGGSVITNKDTNKASFRKSVTKRLLSELKPFTSEFQFILVHGAGSFGHPLAKKYRLNEGYINSDSFKGVALTKLSVLKLSQLFLTEMNGLGINSCLIETSTVAQTTNKKISSFNISSIKSVLKLNNIPVLSGDVVYDSKKKIAILSGDQIVVYLAKKLNASKIIFVSDVDGVYNKNPKKFKDAKLIKEINKKNYREIIENVEMHNSNDVTGEMKGKILTIKENLKNIQAIIINGSKTNNLKNALEEKKLGTRILFTT